MVQLKYLRLKSILKNVYFYRCYVYDIGVVSSPTSPSDINNLTECIWFVEADQSDKGIFLKRNRSTNITTSDGQEQLIMTVSILFWMCSSIWRLHYFNHLLFFAQPVKGIRRLELDRAGVVRRKSFIYSQPTSEILYSISHKVMIKFTRPTSYISGNTAHWDVASVRKHHTSLNLFIVKYSIHTLSIADKF